jgi:hypothetical protein
MVRCVDLVGRHPLYKILYTGKKLLCGNKVIPNKNGPVRIRVRIGPPHPLACRKRRLNPLDETGETEVPCHSRCGTIKIPPCSKALSAEHGPKFCSPSPAMVTSPYKWNILERDIKQ